MTRMHLATRAYVLVLLTAVLAIAGIWSAERSLAEVWRIPAGLLLLGLALEGLFMRRTPIEAQLAIAPRTFLGRPEPVAYVFANRAARALEVEYAPAVPAGFEAPPELRRVHAPARGVAQDPVTLLPVRLGPQPWPRLPARVRGPLALAWWGVTLQPPQRTVVSPDARGGGRRAAPAARLRARRSALAHRLEGDRAQRRAHHPRVQRGSAPRCAARHRRGALQPGARRPPRPLRTVRQRGGAPGTGRHTPGRSHRAGGLCQSPARELCARTRAGGGHALAAHAGGAV